MRLIFLGTGTSFGVPVIGCQCPVCTSDDPRDRRTRHGALLTLPGGNLLIDAPPELRLQLVEGGIGRVDAVWFTHTHADHVHGIDDLRVFSQRGRAPLEVWAAAEVGAELSERFAYAFVGAGRSPDGGGASRPELRLRELTPGSSACILGEDIVPVSAPHGAVTVYGFRIGPLGYLTDAKRLTSEALESLEGVEVLVLNALWLGDPHPTHFNVEEAVAAARRVGAERTYLTHLTHRTSHAELVERLPAGVEPAYDGLAIEIGAEE